MSTTPTAFQQEWKKYLEPLLRDRSKDDLQHDVNAEKMAIVQARLDSKRGFGRLKKPFIRLFSLNPLKRKQRRLEKRIAKKDRKLAGVIDNLFNNYGSLFTTDPEMKMAYNYLKVSYDEVERTKGVVEHAAQRCQNARIVQDIVGVENNGHRFNKDSIIMGLVTGLIAHFNTKSAIKSVRKAQTSVKDLRANLQSAAAVNHVQSADYISSSSSWAVLNDTIGGWFGGWGNWTVAGELKRTRQQLFDVTSQLDKVADSLTSDKVALLAAATLKASDVHPSFLSLAKSLEPYLPPKLPGEERVAEIPASAKPPAEKPANDDQPVAVKPALPTKITRSGTRLQP
jgi:hypothetical protein